MSPTHARKSGRLYRYYISQTAMKQGRSNCPVKLVPAAELERIIIDQVRLLLRTPEVIVQTWRALPRQSAGVSEAEVRSALIGIDELWDELFPAEQARIVELLVERIDMHAERLDIILKIRGLTSLTSELQPKPFQQAAE
ncbi:zinc ribbon domain-containing protein [Bradyrhizobium sp. 44]|uniref:zinc ribbon domain-containing protein n=1 Tax=Bradyrhizobium sp. 44 TaxID=2782675 RepID=UPI001FF93CD4|nr:zinc ribbon domain-containing protein [Bradyrhizobium sp. 44]